ncbi:beta-lactamase family protein [Sphingomonas piscis]|uniref:Beta-lactamase family protein n=2 Tax=Sphingomonas piscis TaxID=2714943 RepID=A0A6G7YSF9_9SPHN|nr:beta-lactamase family protein [Sphingomonas piscis]
MSIVVAAMLATTAVPAAAAQSAKSASAATFSINKARIDRALAQMVSSGRIAGAEALIYKGGREVYFGSAGFADREAKRLIRRDTLFQIFSMTKPVTGVALMQLWEDKRFGLDDPLFKYLPEYAQTKVFAGMDASGKPILKAPDRPILVRDILRHTAGFSYGPGDTYPEKIFAQVEPLNLNEDLSAFSRKNATVPLQFEPGTQWRYSVAVDVQAALIEKLTGTTLEQYVRSHILDPLGMKETGWTQPAERYARLATPYEVVDGKLVRQPEAAIKRMNFSGAKLTMGGAGLVSSIDDYMRFARMLLGKGSYNGVRLLKPSTVKLMATDHLDARVTERQWLGSKGSGGFGFDFFVRTAQPQTAAENRGALGEFFWDGAMTTLFWIDPANDLAAVFLVQKQPFDGTLHHDFREAVYGPSYLGPKGD